MRKTNDLKQSVVCFLLIERDLDVFDVQISPSPRRPFKLLCVSLLDRQALSQLYSLSLWPFPSPVEFLEFDFSSHTHALSPSPWSKAHLNQRKISIILPVLVSPYRLSFHDQNILSCQAGTLPQRSGGMKVRFPSLQPSPPNCQLFRTNSHLRQLDPHALWTVSVNVCFFCSLRS
jgi:hypothetical protein